jgi:hypothetical protein
MTQRSAWLSIAGLTWQVRTRPTFALVTSPDSSRTFRCNMAPASDMGSGLASSLTVAGPWVSCSTMARRVGSAKAAKVLSRLYSSMCLCISRQFYCQAIA